MEQRRVRKRRIRLRNGRAAAQRGLVVSAQVVGARELHLGVEQPGRVLGHLVQHARRLAKQLRSTGALVEGRAVRLATVLEVLARDLEQKVRVEARVEGRAEWKLASLGQLLRARAVEMADGRVDVLVPPARDQRHVEAHLGRRRCLQLLDELKLHLGVEDLAREDLALDQKGHHLIGALLK